jgi:vanillate O-demethylase ferredoxin subunit
MLASNEWMDAVLLATSDLTPTVREFTLQPARPVRSYPAGSHILIGVRVDGREDVRSYSLVGAGRDGSLRIAVKRVEPGRGGSRWMFGLEAGTALRISAPRSNFNLSASGRSYLLIAGGIGITPLRGMASILKRRGADLRFLYGVRSAEELAFADELRDELGDRLAIFLDDKGERPDLAAEFAALPPDAEAYVCGPLGLLKAAQKTWQALGRDPTRLRYETFGAAGGGEARPFVVRLPDLDLEVPVAAGQTMLDALEEAGVAVLSDCRKGECGLCVLEVVKHEGPLDHRDVFLSEAQHHEGRKICACVSRAAGGRLTVLPTYRFDTVFDLDKARGVNWKGVRQETA